MAGQTSILDAAPVAAAAAAAAVMLLLLERVVGGVWMGSQILGVGYMDEHIPFYQYVYVNKGEGSE